MHCFPQEPKAEKVTEAFTGSEKAAEKTVEETKPGQPEVEHQYELVVCHMNVIRYFVCRALQLPPEAWLRFRGDNCGLTEIIVLFVFMRRVFCCIWR